MRVAPRIAIALIALGAPAGAQAASAVSSNWAGYVVRPVAAKRLRSVSGTWVEPAVDCTPGQTSYSAVWVGLGGYSANATGLEQIGADSDCTGSGRAVYSAWVELLPAAPTGLSLKLHAGDRITASVTVIGRDATLGLHNLTTGAKASRTVRVKSEDVSSAEWIVEAPSDCYANGHCRTLPLADFGSVAFTSATATLGPATATIAGGPWAATSLQLQGIRSLRAAGQPGQTALVLATPSTSSATDGSFTVSYSERSGETPGQEAAAVPGFTGGPPG
jgi:hypothetical protein